MEVKPSFSEFELMAKQGNLIPVFQEFLGDTDTSVSAYLKISDKSFSYLLESADSGTKWGRYSFIGYKPYLTVIFRGNGAEIWRGKRRNVLSNVSNPLHVLRGLHEEFRLVTMDHLAPFQGGLVGYFNYDLVRKWEHLPGISPEHPDIPESIFTVSRRLIIFDHLSHHIKVVVFAHLPREKDLMEAYTQACQEVKEIMDDLHCPLSGISSEGEEISLSELEANISREDFEHAVEKAKGYIADGDVIQVVLSQKFSGYVFGDDFILYRNLRSINPSPYMFYLNFGNIRLIGSSPEILVRLTNRKIELRPIAGTRPRGKTPEEDLKLEKELMADPKERAEHIMLVDLGRNDVGKTAMPGSVTVPRLMDVERYSHVMHMVSSVEGELKQEMDVFDLFVSVFPAGTVTGAPKTRAMEIISELEPSPRGPYAGAVGYFAFNGNMDFCITIRTIAIIRNRVSIQVGAGIVYDSSPVLEYKETLRKAAAMLKALEKASNTGRSCATHCSEHGNALPHSSTNQTLRIWRERRPTHDSDDR